MTERFYDSAYWQTGEGRGLWQLRKVMTVVMAMSNDDTPPPFITMLGEEPKNFDGWYAEWTIRTKNEKGISVPEMSLTVEYEDNSLCIYAMGSEGEKDYNMRFWYEFDDPNAGRPEGEPITKKRLDEAIAAGRNWLEINREALKKEQDSNSIYRTFNLM
jgi:hypothetical protein